MGLFDDQVAILSKYIDGCKKAALPLPDSDWPKESSLVLEEDAKLELGNPAVGSTSFILWNETDKPVEDRMTLVGPDIQEMTTGSFPFRQIILVHGNFTDEYECYQEIKDALYETFLQGMMIRSHPSRQSLWFRIDQEAYAKGLSLAHWGAALIERLKEVQFVTGVELFFITSDQVDVEPIKDMAFEAGRIVGALMKMGEEMDYDCDSCEFWDVCKDVEELKRIRKRMEKGKAQ